MKYCVKHNLSMNNPSNQNNFDKEFKAKIGGKKVWGETIIGSGKNEENKPSHTVVIRFDNETDMDDLFNFIKNKMMNVPWLKGTVTKHYCSHDVTPESCVILEEYSK